MVAPLRVGIAGLGTVGAEVVGLIEQQKRALSLRCGRGIRVVAVSARSKVKKRNVDLTGIAWAKNALAIATDPKIDVFVELMGGVGDPALSAIEAALRSGMTPDSLVLDAPLTIADWSPKNHEGHYANREIHLRNAFAGSSNVAVRSTTRPPLARPFLSSRRCAKVLPGLISIASMASSTAPATTS